jgi:hypothetical protein
MYRQTHMAPDELLMSIFVPETRRYASRAIFASSTPILPPSKVSFDADEHLRYGSSSFRKRSLLGLFYCEFP